MSDSPLLLLLLLVVEPVRSAPDESLEDESLEDESLEDESPCSSSPSTPVVGLDSSSTFTPSSAEDESVSLAWLASSLAPAVHPSGIPALPIVQVETAAPRWHPTR